MVRQLTAIIQNCFMMEFLPVNQEYRGEAYKREVFADLLVQEYRNRLEDFN